MPAKTMTGARAQLTVGDPNGQGGGKVVGIFNNVSYGTTYDVQPIFILGRYSAAETVYTAQEVVSVTASGFRIIDHGAHIDGKVPTLDQLMTHEYLNLTIIDRQNPTKRIAHIRNVRPTSYSTGFNAKDVSTVTINFVGILVDDESVENNESDGATELP